MKQLETDSSVTSLLNQILKVASSIPTKMEVDDVIKKFYDKNNVSAEESREFDMVLRSLGIDKINQEGLDLYVSNLITKNSGLPVEHSARVLNGARTLITSLLQRIEIQKEVNRLKFSNSQRELELKNEIDIRSKEIDSRITEQNLLISKYKEEIEVKNLTAEQLIAATEKFLGVDVNRQKIREDVEELLNGNTNIIIEL